MARDTSSAMTAESTPPESAQTTRPSPTWAPHALDRLLEEVRHRPVQCDPADVEEEVPQDPRPLLRVDDLRMELDGVEAPLRDPSTAAWGAFEVVPDVLNDGREGVDPVSVAHPDAGAPGVLSRSREGPVGRVRPGRTRTRPRGDLPAQRAHRRLHPVADPRHRSAGSNRARSAPGAPGR